jgi:methylated-DNA-[protein]-cysteine S-methyltransferase
MKSIKALQFLPEDVVYDEMNSPVGKLILVASSKGLHIVTWEGGKDKEIYYQILNSLTKSKNNNVILKTKTQLSEYFSHKRKEFDLPLVMNGTDFQIKAWNELCKIPYATTISYGEQAEKVGDKKKARAVGAANGKNWIPIIIPCHRVVGVNGHLVGFAGGVDKKAFLLQLEKSG